MAEHLSDEEQLENLKRWWKENGLQTIAAVVIVGLGYFGWGFWKDYQQQQAEAGSALYQQMITAVMAAPGESPSDQQRAVAVSYAVTLKTDHSGSQYAHFASLLMARLAVEQDDLDTAAAELQTVVDAADEGLSLVARLRLAKVEAARGQLDQAIAILEGVDAKTLASAYAEARGDLQLTKGERKLAYQAYQEALDKLGDNEIRSRPLLEIKINQVKPQANLAVENSEEEA